MGMSIPVSLIDIRMHILTKTCPLALTLIHVNSGSLIL